MLADMVSLPRLLVLVGSMVVSAAAVFAQPVVHLTFDNPGQLAADFSGNNRNGTANGNLNARGNGVAGGAAQFDGSTSFISLDNSVASTLAGDFTISLWVETTATFGSDNDNALQGAGIVAADNGQSADAALGLTGNRIGYGVANDNAALHSQSAVNTGSFVHVVVTQNASTGERSVFVNGALEATQQASNTAINVQGLLALGASPSQGRYFAGAVDDFQVYNQALNASSVAYLHANPGSAVAFAVVPEPSSLLLLALGVGVIGVLQWQRWRNT
ncbi:MAG: hypothetical protein C0518_10700 [Opitutus sp.]|nr:hypothetical protein [Opitutus sp.]